MPIVGTREWALAEITRLQTVVADMESKRQSLALANDFQCNEIRRLTALLVSRGDEVKQFEKRHRATFDEQMRMEAGWRGEYERLKEAAEIKVDRLRRGLQRIVDGEAPVRGLREQFYGHAKAIAEETLAADVMEKAGSMTIDQQQPSRPSRQVLIKEYKRAVADFISTVPLPADYVAEIDAQRKSPNPIKINEGMLLAIYAIVGHVTADAVEEVRGD